MNIFFYYVNILEAGPINIWLDLSSWTTSRNQFLETVHIIKLFLKIYFESDFFCSFQRH